MKHTKNHRYQNDLHAAILEKVCASLHHALTDISPDASKVDGDTFEIPPDASLGDIALPCFSLAKSLKKSPAHIAETLAEKMSARLKKGTPIHRIVATGPYVNLFLASDYLAHELFEKKSPIRKKIAKPTRVLIEYVSSNTNKPLHIGHVRNGLLGEALSRILEAHGESVVRTCLFNDRGIHICKSMIGYDLIAKKHPNRALSPKTLNLKEDHFVGECYVAFEQQRKKDESILDTAQNCLQKWEEKDVDTHRLWKKMNAWALRGIHATLKRLAIIFDTIYYESAFYTQGKDIILQAANAQIFQRDETGAITADLSTDNLPDKVLLRRDGTSLYITQDIALAYRKAKDFKAQEYIYVVGSEQNLYLQQLFAVLRKLSFPGSSQLHHLSYGMVNLPEGKMKSREGTVVDADDLLDELTTLGVEEVKIRDAHLSHKEVQKRAEIIALAALKFYMLHVNPASDMLFNPKESLSFQGKTGPYLLYTYARLRSILRKAGRLKKVSTPIYDWLPEKKLLLRLSRYPGIIEKSRREYNPAILANFLYDIAQDTNDYYHETPVLQADTSIRMHRLTLVTEIASTLKHGLDLLGIKTLDKM